MTMTQDTSFYLFTWDDEGPVAGSQIMTFNPDRPEAETWQLYQELLQVSWFSKEKSMVVTSSDGGWTLYRKIQHTFRV